MKQAALPINLNIKKTRKQVFLEQMEQVVPWADLISLIAPFYPEGKNGRPPFPLMTMLRTHFMQQWFTLSDPAMEEAFFDTPLYRAFAQLEEFARLPDESTILRFGKTPSPRHRLEKHKLAEQILITVNELLTSKGLLLKAGTVVDATLIAAPTSTKNKDRARDPDMHSSKKGNQWYFGMKAHIGADAESGLVHTVRGTSGNVGDVTEGNSLLHGQEATVHADAGYQGGDKRADANEDATWHIAMGPGKRKTLNKDDPADALIDKAEKLTQGGCACQSGAFVSGDQAPVRLCESPLPWFEEKHSAARDTICAVQFVDGAWQIDSGAEMSAPENRAKALQSVKTAQWGSRFNTSAGDYS